MKKMADREVISFLDSFENIFKLMSKYMEILNELEKTQDEKFVEMVKEMGGTPEEIGESISQKNAKLGEAYLDVVVAMGEIKVSKNPTEMSIKARKELSTKFLNISRKFRTLKSRFKKTTKKKKMKKTKRRKK